MSQDESTLSLQRGWPRGVVGRAGLIAVANVLIAPIAAAQEAAPSPLPVAVAEAPAQLVQTLETVTISASAQRKLKQSVSSGALGSRSVLDTPFSSKVVDIQDMQSRQVQTVDEVFNLDSSAKAAQNGVSGINALVSVRGLLLDYLNGYKIDGLAYANRVPLPMESFQQVELLKGLTGFMSGFGAPGGLVNYVLKRPTDRSFQRLSLGYATGSLFRAHVDLGGRFGSEHAFGYRLNAVRESGNTYLHGGSLHRSSASLAVEAQLTHDLTWSADVLAQDRNNQGLTANVTVPQNPSILMPAPIKGSTGLAEDGAYYKTRTVISTTGLEWQIAPDWTSSANFRSSAQRPEFRESAVNVFNNNGDFKLQESLQRQDFDFRQLQAMVEGKIKTGAIVHQLVVGASWQRLLTIGNNTSASVNLPTISNLYAPVHIAASGVSVDSVFVPNITNYRQTSMFASDTLQFAANWSILLGARSSNYRQDTYTLAGVNSPFSADTVSPTLALTYKPNRDTALYTSYVEGMDNGGIAPSTAANAGQSYGALKSKQYELGIKSEAKDWSLTAALFRIDRGATYLNPANVFVQDGLLRYQGLELNGSVQASTGLTFGGSVMALDASYQKTVPSIVGHKIPGAARLQVAAEFAYRVAQLPGLKFNGSVRYNDSSMLEPGNFHVVPGYTTLDFGASHRISLGGQILTINAAVKNLADRAYWTVYNSNTPRLQIGAPRIFSVTADLVF